MNRFGTAAFLLALILGTVARGEDPCPPKLLKAFSVSFDAIAMPSNLPAAVAELRATLLKSGTFRTRSTEQRLALLKAERWLVELGSGLDPKLRKTLKIGDTSPTVLIRGKGGDKLAQKIETQWIGPESVVEMLEALLERGITGLREARTALREQRPRLERLLVQISSNPKQAADLQQVFDALQIDLRVNSALSPAALTLLKQQLEAQTLQQRADETARILEEIDDISRELANPLFRKLILPTEPIEQVLLSGLADLVPSEALIPQRAGTLGPNLRRAVSGYAAQDRLLRGNSASEQGDAMASILKSMTLEQRYELYAAAQRDLRAISASVKRTGPPRQVDIAFIGGSLQESNATNFLFQNRSRLSTLTLESRSQFAYTFVNGGRAAFLNSQTRPADLTSLRQKFGSGDLNFLPSGILQLREFVRTRNPTLGDFGGTIALDRAFNRAPIVFETEAELVSIDRKKSRGEYRNLVRLSSGEEVAARMVIQFGTGQRVVPSIKGLSEALAIPVKDKYGVRRVLLSEEVNDHINASKNPLRPFAGKRVAILGAGDSGKGHARWLLYLSGEEAYGDDTRSTPSVDTILWYGQKADTCDQFTRNERLFYSDIAAGFKSKTIKPKNKAVSIERRGNQYLIRTARNGDRQRTEDELVDFIFVATNLDPDIRSLYGDLFAEAPSAKVPGRALIADPKFFRTLYGFETELGVVPIAKQLLSEDGPEDIYLLGAIAPGLITDAELKEIDENRVASALHSWRVTRFMEAARLYLGDVEGSENALLPSAYSLTPLVTPRPRTARRQRPPNFRVQGVQEIQIDPRFQLFFQRMNQRRG